MAMRIRELVLDRFERTGRDYYSAPGDLSSLYALLPNPDGRQLQRAPAWTDHLDLPAGLTGVEGAFYDFTNQRYVFFGVDGSGNLASAYLSANFAWSSVTSLLAATLTLGGLDGMNALLWGGDTYILASNNNVYRGDYASSLSTFYTHGNAQCLAPYGDRIYLATTAGDIWRLNDADTAFEEYYTAVGSLDVRFMTPFRGYLLVVTRAPTGELLLHRLQPDVSSPELDTIGVVPAARGDETLAGLLGTRLFAVQNDELYLSPGRDKLLDENALLLYRFNGSQLDLVNTQPFPVATDPVIFGLAPWRQHLVRYYRTSNAYWFETLVGDRFTTTLETLTDSIPAYATLFSIGGTLFVITQDQAADEGLRYLSETALKDGYLITPRLDMGAPSLQKRLERITVLLDDAAADFDVLIKYRTDDNTSWTTATTATNTRRATVGDLAQTFYTLQVRVDLDDDTGLNKDFRIHAIAVLYSINV